MLTITNSYDNKNIVIYKKVIFSNQCLLKINATNYISRAAWNWKEKKTNTFVYF